MSDLRETVQNLYTEAEHQVELAAVVRKAAETVDAGVSKWQEAECHDPGCGCVSEWVKREILALLTTPMQSALAEHDAQVRAEVADERIDKWETLSANLRKAEFALAEAQKQSKFYLDACSKQNYEVCQTLGKVLGYPWFKDDQKNFPGATEANRICEGEHVAETIASEAANKITALQGALQWALSHGDFTGNESEPEYATALLEGVKE